MIARARAGRARARSSRRGYPLRAAPPPRRPTAAAGALRCDRKGADGAAAAAGRPATRARALRAQSVILDSIFTDPVCGNAHCETPEEYPAFQAADDARGEADFSGQQCQADCGPAPTRAVTVNFYDPWKLWCAGFPPPPPFPSPFPSLPFPASLIPAPRLPRREGAPLPPPPPPPPLLRFARCRRRRPPLEGGRAPPEAARSHARARADASPSAPASRARAGTRTRSWTTFGNGCRG